MCAAFADSPAAFVAGDPPAQGQAEALAEAEAAQGRGDLPACREAAEQAWHAAGGTLPAARHARAGFLLALSLYRLGRFAELAAEGEPIVTALTTSGQTESACQVLRWVALGVPEIGLFDAGLQAARQGLKLAEEGGLLRMRVLLGNALAACFERIGDPWQAERLLGDALALATERCGDEERFVCLNNLSAVALTRHELLRGGPDADSAHAALRRARDFAREALVLAHRLGDPFYCTYVEANLGDALNFLGEHAEAESWLVSALRRTEAHRFDTLRWRVLVSLGELAVERQQMREACERLQPLISTMGASAPQVTLMRAQRALYRALRTLGDAAGALDAFERFHRLERQRSVAQLQAQAEHLVTRLEIEQSRREAIAQAERANAFELAAMRDALTGLLNRRGSERELRALLLRQHGGAEAPVVVAMIDIDHFKTINDTHGHAAGDAVLARLARLLRELGRPQDLVGRLGGEEFLIAWSGIGPERAAEIAERIRQAVAEADWGPVAPGLRVSASIGVATLGPALAADATLGDLLADADLALYRAKRAGRDQVAVAGAAPAGPADPADAADAAG